MNIYLDASTSRADEMNQYASLLYRFGHVVVSRWHTGELGTARLELDNPKLRTRAQDDLDDIDVCDLLLAFTGSGGRGGRHYEAGYAHSRGKVVLVVGPAEHAFHMLHPQYESFDHLVKERLS